MWGFGSASEDIVPVFLMTMAGVGLQVDFLHLSDIGLKAISVVIIWWVILVGLTYPAIQLA